MKPRSRIWRERRPVRHLAALSALVLVAVASACGGGQLPAANSSPLSAAPSATSLGLADLVAKSRPGVVQVSGAFGAGFQSGSGIVVDADKGLVLTNDHVVSGLSSIKVTLNDGKDQVAAAPVAEAPCSDLAVLSLNPKPPGLVALPLGDSNLLRTGDNVAALGYPGAAQDTAQEPQKLSATQGTVSTSNIQSTPDPSLPAYPSVIQHQAPLNPGNSGGPLLNERGEVVGVNTFVRLAPAQGQNYAISISSVKELLPQLEAGQNQHYLGWALWAIGDQDLASYLQQYHYPALPTSQGVFVTYTDSGSAAKAAKFGAGDIITTIEDTPVNSVASVCDIIESRHSGQSIGVDGWQLNASQMAWEPYKRTYITVP